MIAPPEIKITWKPCWRLVPSRFPPRGLFDRVADPADLEAVIAIESLTNDRLRQEAGDISLVPPHERISGPGTTPVMAAFTHINRDGSRFSDGTYGVYYAGREIETSIAETKYHRERFLAATNQKPIEIDMRSYASDVACEFHDVRGLRATHPELYDPDTTRYAEPQALARDLRNTGSNGIAYESVRYPEGQCVAIFRPAIVGPVRQGKHYGYIWDGTSITNVIEKRLVTGV